MQLDEPITKCYVHVRQKQHLLQIANVDRVFVAIAALKQKKLLGQTLAVG